MKKLGALPPKYNFALNPYPESRFFKCPNWATHLKWDKMSGEFEKKHTLILVFVSLMIKKRA